MSRRKKRSLAAKEYWERVAIEQTLGNEKTQQEILRDIGEHYERAKAAISGEINKFYTQYGKDGKLSYEEAVKRLSGTDKAEYLKMVAEYNRKASKYDYDNMNPVDEKWLDETSKRIAITRLEALQDTINKRILSLGMDENNVMTDTLMNTYEDTYYKGLFNLQVASGVGFEFGIPDERTLKNIAGTRYNGENYSDDIWGNKKVLIQNMTDLLGQHFAQGTDIRTLSEKMAERMNVRYSYAERLLRTEANYIAGVSAFDVYEEAGMQKYEFVATLDNRTSPMCQDLDGKTFDVKDKQVGLNCHPMHPYCRSTTVPWFDDEWVTERIAKNEDGRNITVPGNMKYKDWADKYASKRYAAKISGESVVGVVKGRQPKDKVPNKEQAALVKRVAPEIADQFNTVLDVGPEEVRDLLLAAQRKGFNLTNGADDSFFTAIGNRVNVEKFDDLERYLQVTLHEMGHMLDYNFRFDDLGMASTNAHRFNRTINSEYVEWLDQFKAPKRPTTEVFGRASHALRSKFSSREVRYAGISDIFSALSGGNVQGAYGHSKKYWGQSKHLKPAEVFANMFEIYASKDLNDAWDVLGEYLPESKKEFTKLLDDMVKNIPNVEKGAEDE